MLNNNLLVKTLRKKSPDTSIINKLKIGYRPFICPFNEILDIIPDHSTLFDIGCGSGMFLMLFAEFKHPAKVGGIEIDKDLIENAQELLSTYSIPATLSIYDGKDIPEVVSEFEYISMIDVLHHIPKEAQFEFLKDLYRKMKPGSRLILKDIDKANPLVVFNKFHDMVLSGEIGNEVSGSQLKDHLADLGFKINLYKTKTTFWYPHYWIEAIKM